MDAVVSAMLLCLSFIIESQLVPQVFPENSSLFLTILSLRTYSRRVSRQGFSEPFQVASQVPELKLSQI